MATVRLLLAMIMTTSLSAAATRPNGTRLSFVRAENASDCSSTPVLEREIARRMGRDPFAATPGQWIEGFIAKQGDHFEVQLFERDASGATLGTRHLREAAGDCHKLDDAIVLAIALIIDPAAHLAPALPANPALPSPSETALPTVARPPTATIAPPSKPSPSTPTGEASSTVPSSTSRDVAPPSGGLVPSARSDDTAEPRAPNDDASPLAGHSVAPTNLDLYRDALTKTSTSLQGHSLAVTAEAVLLYGAIPGVAPGAALTTRFSIDRARRFAGRVSALYVPEKSDGRSASLLSYGLTALEAGFCAVWSRQRVAWEGCSGFGIGAVHTVVHDPTPFEPGDRLWATIRFDSGVALKLVGPVWLNARLFGFLSPRRWEFRVKDGDGSTQTAFLQNFFMPGAALGLGLHLD